jgi:ubiquinone/menaquinone biosynthesis C-methylase UbiE
MSDDAGIQIHASRMYDAVFGWVIRLSDKPILALSGIGPGDRLLDVATGPGYLALAACTIVGPAGEAVGIDLSPEMVVHARRAAARKGLSAGFVEARAQELPFEDGRFDAVVTRLAVHHIPIGSRARVMDEIRRVLKPGGRVVVADLGSEGANEFHHILGRLLGRPKVENSELKELLADAGFDEIEAGALGVLDYAKGVRA